MKKIIYVTLLAFIFLGCSSSRTSYTEKDFNSLMQRVNQYNKLRASVDPCPKGGAHHYVEVDRVVTKVWYDKGGKRYRRNFNVYHQCQKCGKRKVTQSGN